MNPQEEKRNQTYSFLLWHRLAQMHKNNLKGSSELLKEWNLSNAQIDVLIQVHETERLSQQELADKLLVTKGNITQLLKKLEEMKLIQREKEWKTNYLSLTDEGEKLVQQIKPNLNGYQEDFFKNLSTEEKKQLLDLLRKIER